MINNIKTNTKNAILNGGPIDEIILSSNRTIEVKFNDEHRAISSSITSYYLGKCVHDYLKLQIKKQGELQDKQINIVNNGLTKIQFRKYQNKIAEAFHNLFCLNSSNNYTHQNKD